jgi:O-acetyl-ADP-ribose deacetylase (regulator of RNase III)
MLKFVKGNIFTYPGIMIRINPVNCVGIMGAGLAKQFRLKYPRANVEYQKLCDDKKIQLGKIYPVFADDYSTMIFFPTKYIYSDKSYIKDINDGLQSLHDFIVVYSNLPKYVIGIPAIGCGLGGLNWKDVKESIVRYLNDLDATIIVFEPY